MQLQLILQRVLKLAMILLLDDGFEQHLILIEVRLKQLGRNRLWCLWLLGCGSGSGGRLRLCWRGGCWCRLGCSSDCRDGHSAWLLLWVLSISNLLLLLLLLLLPDCKLIQHGDLSLLLSGRHRRGWSA